ncbi:MAG: glycosyltransferase [Deltaproteobacteria bacterium]|nr:glycosyltransferase [Deltaproteobacteria bacterium]
MLASNVNMAWPAIILLVTQFLMLAVFTFFAFFNYLYGIASLWKQRVRRTQPSGKRVAVVIVAFNEKYVLEKTIRACECLSYPNKLILLGDDSTDPQVVERLRSFAVSRGCKKVLRHPFSQEMNEGYELSRKEPIEIWESPDFVFFHRPSNAGFKAGNLDKVLRYLASRNIDFMYLLDADWHPQQDALERTLEVIEAHEDVAFIQTKRLSFPTGMNLFQRYLTLVEEGCYYIDFEGRQVLGHPILFSGCCTLFRLDAVTRVGGFSPGHLTEDLDLTDRLWLDGWKGIYLGDVINHGEVPFTYDHYRRQQERWAAGSARALRDFFRPIIRTKKFGWFEKLSAIRQNAYYTTTLLTGSAILLGMTTVLFLALAWGTYSAEYYLYVMETLKTPFIILLYFCILSNFVEPLIMILVKKRRYRELFHLPMMVWYAWSVLIAYIIGNIKGLFGFKLGWFRTPKLLRSDVGHLPRLPAFMRTLNLCTCLALVCLYFSQGWFFGWFDEFALLWIPAFLLASIK